MSDFVVNKEWLAIAPVPLGEWLPDLPVLGNPGLIQCSNVVPYAGHYETFSSSTVLSAGNYTMSATPAGMFVASNADVYVGTVDRLYATDNTFKQTARSATLAGLGGAYEWSFAQYNNQIVATRDGTLPLTHTLTSASNFSTLSAEAPTAQFVSTIGQFLFLGNLTSITDGSHAVQWSGINQISSFPPPNSTTATAQQSGRQYLDVNYGAVMGFSAGDQFGLIFQQYAVTRATYVGPPAVFQFDVIDRVHGLNWPTAAIRVGAITYFLANDGFYETDGTSVAPIGAGKIDKTFFQSYYGSLARVAFDQRRKIIIWSVPQVGGGGLASKLYCYHIESRRWAVCDTFLRGITTAESGSMTPWLYNTSNILQYFGGSALTSILETGELELNPGGRAFVSGVKPNFETGSVDVSVGSRSDNSTSSATYSTTTTPTAATGFSDCRVDARYHRAYLVGTFQKAYSVEFKACASAMR